MNKRILVIVATLFTVAMIVSPVFAAIGPTKAKNNKNLIVQAGNSVWMLNKGGVFQEWNTFEVSGIKYHLMRKCVQSQHRRCCGCISMAFSGKSIIDLFCDVTYG